jgi:hypothetical protein
MCSSHRLSVTLLGPDIAHRKMFEAMLAGRVSRLTWLSDSLSLPISRPRAAGQRIQKLFDQLTHTHDSAFLANTCRHLDENQTDVIIAYWGTGPLADIVAIKRLRPQIKILLMPACFPLALDTVGIQRQHWLMRHAAPSLDGMLYPSVAMRDYFHDQVLGARGRHLQELILKICWPQNFQVAAGQNEQGIDHPNLVFIGRTDLSSHTIHAADDLRPLMEEILENQIELHHGSSPETSDGHPYRRPFQPLDMVALIARMAAHDASLIAYNAAACRRTERLNLTVPERLATSVAAGIPIAIPSMGYIGPKQYLAEYPAVLEFDSVPDLKRKLEDRQHIQALREAAWQARKLYSAEAQGDILAQFLESI